MTNETLTYRPLAPRSIEETGLNSNFLADLILKTLYFQGELTAGNIAESLKLPLTGVLDKVLAFLREEKFCEVKGSTGYLAANWRHSLTEKGVKKINEILLRDQYSGPAPISLSSYGELIEKQTVKNSQITEDKVRVKFSNLVLKSITLDQLGCAVNSAKSIFIYGHAGNGKTYITEHLSQLLGSEVLVPYAIEVDNQIIKIFDPVIHQPQEVSSSSDEAGKKSKYDTRYVLTKRPFVMVGGELKLENLNLKYDYESKFYSAPLQLKANNGMLLIDDFGRQEVSPRELLNRWIVPLEKGVDYLTLHTGKSICIPFDQIILFSTNLDPKDLVDEAFLRRIRYKIEIPDPNEEMFREIFRRYCEQRSIDYKKEMLDYLIRKHYYEKERTFRSCHPRDLIEQIIDRAKYKNIPPELTEEAIDYACATYFVEI